jgi:FtsP/CotA-like multicopper oxidase with cupredoxin domain
MKTRQVRPRGPRRPAKLSRRIAAWGAALLLGGVLASASAPSRETIKLETAPALTAATLEKAQLFTMEAAEWKDPPEARCPGPQPFPLVVDFATNQVEVGTEGKLQTVRLRSYNGGLVGPTFRVKPGDTLKIDLYNRLPKPPPAAHASMEQCGIHEHNDVTNLHTHGLHISPSGESDNVLREIEPGGPGAPASHFVFKILPNGNPAGWPAVDHFPGTHWYHAHLHGGTAVQLASGMAGALFVEGDIDYIPAIRAARERIFLFQQLAFDAKGEIQSFKDLNDNWVGKDPAKNGPKKHTSINGVVKPLIRLRPGQVERWRMIDAGVFELLDLSLRKQGDPSKTLIFYQLALDGITLPRVRRATQVELAPGYRVDALVKAPLEKGTYLLYKSRPRLNLLAFATDVPAAQQDPAPEILAQVVVEGDPCTSPVHPCSTALVDPRTVLGAPFKDIAKDEIKDPAQDVTFSVVGPPLKFQVNGKCFDPDQVLPEFDLRLGSAKEWVLKNTSLGPHPFHIHVNPFQLVNSDGSPGDWRDTIVVPPGTDGVRIRTRIERFTGKYVLHCHILTHEDQGMMQLVEVKEK